MKENRNKSNNKSNRQSESASMGLELDLAALQLKNDNLTKTVAKLQMENADLRKDLNNLRKENFDFQSSCINSNNLIKHIESITRFCTPKLMDLLNTIMEIIDVSSSKTITKNSMKSKDPITQTVKPHIVNGTVIQNPTVTLTRLSNMESPKSHTPAKQAHRTSRMEEQPSSSCIVQENEMQNFEREEQENGEKTFISKRSLYHQKLDMSLDDSGEEDEEEESDQESNSDNSNKRLSTIQEEMSNVSVPSNTVLSGYFQEVTIYLNKLPDDLSKTGSPIQRKSSTSSTDAQASQSFINMTSKQAIDSSESPGIENKHLSPFYPRGNSTRIDIEEPSLLPIIRHMSARGKSTTPENTTNLNSVSNVSSCNATPDNNTVLLHNFQTPAASEMGDIEAVEDDKLSTFNQLALSAIGDSTKSTPKSTSRKSKRIRLEPGPLTGTANPIDSKAHRKKSTISKNGTLRNSQELEPMVELRRIESLLPGGKISLSPVNLNNIKTPLKSTSAKKGRSRSGKSTNPLNKESSNNSSTFTIGELRKRLSDYMPNSPKRSDTEMSSPSPRKKGRPKRAARPISLKEPLLNKKMRRS